MNNQEDREIQELMKEAPLGSETPSKLKSRLQSAAVGPRVRHTSPWPARLAMAAVAGVTVLAIGLSMSPTKAEAKSFAKVVNATNQLDAFQLLIRTNDHKGSDISVGFTDGTFNMKTDEGMIMQVEGSEMRFYDPKKNELVEMDLGGVVDPKVVASQIKKGLEKGMEEFDLKKMLGDMEQQYGKENIHVGPIVHKFGRSTYDIDMAKPGDNDRVHLTVDADTDLPLNILVEKQKDGAYHPETEIQLRFGNDIDPNTVKASFPKNAKKVHLDLGKMMEEGMKGDHQDAAGMVEGFKNLGRGMEHFGEGRTHVDVPAKEVIVR